MRFPVFLSRVAVLVFILPVIQATAAPLGYETVEFQLSRFVGDDAYPEYFQIDAEGRTTSTKASLRCVESAYDGDAVWRYQELMVFDASGKVIARKERRPNVPSERGYHYAFQSFAACEKAAPTEFDDNLICTMKLELSRAKNAARFVSANCRTR